MSLRDRLRLRLLQEGHIRCFYTFFIYRILYILSHRFRTIPLSHFITFHLTINNWHCMHNSPSRYHQARTICRVYSTNHQSVFINTIPSNLKPNKFFSLQCPSSWHSYFHPCWENILPLGPLGCWFARPLARQSACIALYYRGTWNVMERTAYI